MMSQNTCTHAIKVVTSTTAVLSQPAGNRDGYPTLHPKLWFIPSKSRPKTSVWLDLNLQFLIVRVEVWVLHLMCTQDYKFNEKVLAKATNQRTLHCNIYFSDPNKFVQHAIH